MHGSSAKADLCFFFAANEVLHLRCWQTVTVGQSCSASAYSLFSALEDFPECIFPFFWQPLKILPTGDWRWPGSQDASLSRWRGGGGGERGSAVVHGAVDCRDWSSVLQL